MAKEKPKSQRFRIVGVVPGQIHFKGKFFDLSTINYTQAKELADAKCPYIELGDEPADEATEDNPQ